MLITVPASWLKLLAHEDGQWQTELTELELVEACGARGLRTDVPQEQLVTQLSEWIEHWKKHPPLSESVLLYTAPLSTPLSRN